MADRPWILEEATLPEVRGRDWEVAVLPWGATEPHNLHLPYGTDSIQAAAVARESARQAFEAGAGVIVLPTIPIGVNGQQLGFPMTLNLHPSTQVQLLRDLIESLEHHGVRKLMVLNGHGGNDFRQMIRELQLETGIFLCAVNWYTVLPADRFFDEPGDHAGELETSVVMHLRPELVRPLDEAGPGQARSLKLSGFREGWAWAPREWSQVTEDSGVGDPSAATAEKGERFFDAVTGRIGDFLVELAGADPEEMYEGP